MKILIVDGFGENPITATWSTTLTTSLVALGHTVVSRAWNTVVLADFTAVNAVIAYSWGVAATWWINHGSPACEKLVVIAGVPNPFFGQLGGWAVGPRTLSAINFHLSWADDYFLEDPVFSNTGVPTIELSTGLNGPFATITNVDCDASGDNHGSIPLDNAVQSTILSFIGKA